MSKCGRKYKRQDNYDIHMCQLQTRHHQTHGGARKAAAESRQRLKGSHAWREKQRILDGLQELTKLYEAQFRLATERAAAIYYQKADCGQSFAGRASRDPKADCDISRRWSWMAWTTSTIWLSPRRSQTTRLVRTCSGEHLASRLITLTYLSCSRETAAKIVSFIKPRKTERQIAHVASVVKQWVLSILLTIA